MRGIAPQLRPVCCLGTDLAVKDSDQILRIGPSLVSGPGGEVFIDFNDDRYPHRPGKVCQLRGRLFRPDSRGRPGAGSGPTAMLMAGPRQPKPPTKS